jgi:hypothetical protein
MKEIINQTLYKFFFVLTLLLLAVSAGAVLAATVYLIYLLPYKAFIFGALAGILFLCFLDTLRNGQD